MQLLPVSFPDEDFFPSFTHLRRSALLTTQTLLKLMAAAPNIGFNFNPQIGYKSPAASGMPMLL